MEGKGHPKGRESCQIQASWGKGLILGTPPPPSRVAREKECCGQEGETAGSRIWLIYLHPWPVIEAPGCQGQLSP